MRKKNELEHLKKCYDLETPDVKCFGVDKEVAKEIILNLDEFANKTNMNGPDLVSRYENNIIGIEHFEYDLSGKNKNGSKIIRKINRIKKDFEEKYKKEIIEDGIIITKDYDINTPMSIDGLKNSFIANFKNHKDHIEGYKRNLRKKYGIDIPIWFLAEDSSIYIARHYPGYIADSHPFSPILPVFFNDIQDMLLDTGVQGLIIASSAPIDNYFIFIKNDRENLNSLRRYYNFINGSTVEILSDSKLQCLGFYSGKKDSS